MTIDKDKLGKLGAFLKNATLIHRRYRLYTKNAEWDHDHCEFCGAKFSLTDDPENLKQGYATEDDYHWICEQCFGELHDHFEWKTIEELK